jgi:hypothetical protein
MRPGLPLLLGRLLVVAVLIGLPGGLAGCEKTETRPIFKIESSAVNGPGTLGISALGQPVKGVVVYFHGMDQTADATQSDLKHKSFVQALLQAGYAVVSANAGGNAFGNMNSRVAYRDLMKSAEEKYHAPTEFFVAESMGALPALALLSEPAGQKIKGMVGISPLMGIPPDGRSINFIAHAWGGHVPGDADPLSWPPQAFAGRKFDLYYSDADVVVPREASAYAFRDRFSSVADVRITACAGGHVAGDCFRGGDVVAWMVSLK